MRHIHLSERPQFDRSPRSLKILWIVSSVKALQQLPQIGSLLHDRFDITAARGHPSYAAPNSGETSMARENYGIDAPIVVRNMALGSLVCAVLWAASLFPQAGILHDLGPLFQGPCIGLLVGTSWMLASSLWLKQIVRNRLLDSRKWRGDEQALDVGCGRGLVAVGIARRLGPQGGVRGLDLWQAVDLSGNTPERALANAAVAGVVDKVTIDSGDMRAMPYPNEAFDVVASMTAIHNVPDRQGWTQAISEIWRVTKPGGEILIFDIRHARSYAAQLRGLGAQVKLTGPVILWGPIGWRFSAKKPA